MQSQQHPWITNLELNENEKKMFYFESVNFSNPIIIESPVKRKNTKNSIKKDLTVHFEDFLRKSEDKDKLKTKFLTTKIDIDTDKSEIHKLNFQFLSGKVPSYLQPIGHSKEQKLIKKDFIFDKNKILSKINLSDNSNSKILNKSSKSNKSGISSNMSTNNKQANLITEETNEKKDEKQSSAFGFKNIKITLPKNKLRNSMNFNSNNLGKSQLNLKTTKKSGFSTNEQIDNIINKIKNGGVINILQNSENNLGKTSFFPPVISKISLLNNRVEDKNKELIDFSKRNDGLGSLVKYTNYNDEVANTNERVLITRNESYRNIKNNSIIVNNPPTCKLNSNINFDSYSNIIGSVNSEDVIKKIREKKNSKSMGAFNINKLGVFIN